MSEINIHQIKCYCCDTEYENKNLLVWLLLRHRLNYQIQNPVRVLNQQGKNGFPLPI